jgi:hypothetical protein
LIQIDGKLRTEHLAKTTVDTSRFVFDARWVIAFGVEFLRCLQHVAWTVFHAKAATFAPLFQDVDSTTRDLQLLDIQWLSPILHFGLPLLHLQCSPGEKSGGTPECTPAKLAVCPFRKLCYSPFVPAQKYNTLP